MRANERDRLHARMQPLAVSSLPVKLAYDMQMVERELDRALPRTLIQQPEERALPAHPNIRYAIQAEREGLKLSLDRDTLALTMDVGYRSSISYNTPFGRAATGRCGAANDGAFRAQVQLSSPLQIDSTWTPRTSVQVDRVAPRSRDDRCTIEVLGSRIDVTDAVMQVLHRALSEQTGTFDSAIASQPVRPAMEVIWQRLQQPLQLHENVWLALRPSGLGYGSIVQSGGALESDIVAQIRPDLQWGNASSAQSDPLPPPTESRQDQASDTLQSDVFLSFVELAPHLADALVGQNASIGGMTIEVTAASLWGTATGRLIARLHVAGDVNAIVTVTGSPVIDAEDGTLAFPDLDFSIDSASRLVRAAGWVTRTFFSGRARREAQFPLRTVLQETEMMENLAFEHSLGQETRMKGSFTDLSIVDVEAQEEHLLLRASMTADLQLIGGPVEVSHR